MEPPVSIKAETLLNSKNFLPVAGVQLAALRVTELFFFDLLPEFVGSFQAKIVLKLKKLTTNNNVKYFFISF